MRSLSIWGGERLANGETLALGLVASLAWPVSAGQLGLYAPRRRAGLGEVGLQLALAGVLATALMMAGAFVVARPLPAAFVLGLGLAQAQVLGGAHLVLRAALRVVRRLGHNVRNVLLV